MIRTYYFRTTFNLDHDPAVSDISLEINCLIDDGAVIYINGSEALRIRMPEGTIDYTTAAYYPDTPDAENEVYSLPCDALVQGQNLIAVEVHQAGSGSSDMVMGIKLDANITTTIEIAFGETVLEPGEHIVVVKNPGAFAERYPDVNDQKVFGPYTGNLDNNDETIELVDANGTTIQEFEYEDNWRDITDGDGYSLTIINPDDPNLNNWDKKDYWRASAYVYGSPAADDDGIIPNPGDIVINEVLTCSDVGADDWIELHNTTDTAIEISGWFLSDDSNDLTKYQIPPSTWIIANKYIVFNEDHFGSVFGLSKNGEEVYLTSHLDADLNLTGYRDTEDFGASERDVTFGRHYRSSTDTYNFVAMDDPTYGDDNAYPKVGPIVISEIMYNPEFIHPDAEYIELKNISGSTVAFDIASVPWAFTDGIEFTFPVGTTLPAGDYLLIVKDITAFEARYTAPGGVTVLEWESGSLRNAGEKVELSMPGDMDGDQRCYIRIDRVNYSDGSHPSDCPGNIDPWPTSADGGGKSLTKTGTALYGNDVANWYAENPSPGQ